MVNLVFPKISKFNPKIRFLVLSTDKKPFDLQKMFVDAWKLFKIYDLFIAHLEDFQKHFDDFSVFAFDTFNELSKNRLIELKIYSNFTTNLEKFQKDRHSNLNGRKLKVVLFRFMMVCEGIEYQNGSYNIESLKYQDAEALKILSKVANFSIEFVKSQDNVNHGYQTSNFTFTGSLGMVEHELVDLAANSRLVAEYNTSNTLCLFPLTTTKLKFTVPKKLWNEVNIMLSIYNLFDNSLKLSFLAMFLVLPLLVYTFDKFNGSMESSLIKNYLMFYSIMSFVSVKLPSYWPSRFVTGSAVIVWLVIGNTYAGKMIEFLNTNYRLKQISSIEEMTKTNLDVKIPYPMAVLFEGNFVNATTSHSFINKIVKKSRELEKVGDKMAFIDVENMGEMIRSRNYALFFLENLIELLEKSYYDDNGNDLITHIEETPYEYYYAFSVPKTSPFVNRFNEILSNTFEAGIAKHQMNFAKAETDLILIKRLKSGKLQSNIVKSISFNQLHSTFYLFGLSLIVCFCVFLLETLIAATVKLNENSPN